MKRLNNFDQLPVTQRQAATTFGRCVVALTAAAVLAQPASGQFTQLGPLVEVSLPNPLAGCSDGFVLPGNMTGNDSCEPSIAVNPVNPSNIAAIWTAGGFLGVVVGASFDAGLTWQRVPLPVTVCAGGFSLLAGDVGVSFAPNGDLYAICACGQSLGETEIAVCKSTDGGLHWAPPVVVPNSLYNSHGAINTDPFDSRFVYGIWNGNPKNTDPADFSRSTDGGLTWQPAQTIFSAGPMSQAFVSGNQICVLPNGTLVALNQLVTIQNHDGGCAQRSYSIVVLNSTDRGQTWSAPVANLPMTPYNDPCSGATVFDPNTGLSSIEENGDPMFAVDSRNGALYAVWEDGRWANFQRNDVAFSMSADGGLTWSLPIRINQTPLNIPPGNGQAFLPSVAVAADGTVGVTYYDFRFNGSGPGLLTDYWLVQCHPTSKRPATDPTNWGNELRLTDSSFNLETAFTVFGYFLGDYVALAGGGQGFAAVFTAVDQYSHTAIFTRRVGQ